MAECVHNIPGRARFRIPALRHSETVAAALRQRLSGTDGIAEVDIRRQSASLIVRYNPDALDADTLHILVLGHRPAPMAPQAPPAPRKDTAREIVPPSNRTRQALRYVSGVAGAAALNAILERVVKTGIGVVLRSARIPI
ncbi:MAG: HMA2 domain-containing protein [Magnetospirillum sp.]